MKKYRLRYAPSPTGYLHIGNTRTALMDYLFAKHFSGDFILRIEDTDLARNVEDAIDSQFDNLNWLGILPDESFKNPGDAKYGKYMQSEKFDHYQKIADNLVQSGHAYKCFCTAEELEKDYEEQTSRGIIATKYNRKCLNLSLEEIKIKEQANKGFTIRFKVPTEKSWTIKDLVRGDVTFEGKELGDFVILKANKIATYNFAVVVDDHDMEISHVVRGEEHISNTPRQMMIYDALGWEYPEFCHLTLIVDSTGKKLSKRSGNALFFIEQYKNQGYLPEAMFNYIALLGWSPAGEKEILSKEELIKMFDEKRFTKAPSTFDMVKMKWINSQYMKKLTDEEYLNFTINFVDCEKFDINLKDKQWVDTMLLLFKKEIEFGAQINDHLGLFFNNSSLTNDVKNILNDLERHQELISIFKTKLEEINDWSVESIKKAITESSNQTGLKGKNLYMTIRIYTSHSEHGPSLADVIYLLGKEKVIENISTIEEKN